MMKGWKTWTGCLIAVAMGFYLVLFSDRYEFGAGLISIGFMAMGIGHKIEKAK